MANKDLVLDINSDKPVSARGKTALVINGITLDDIKKFEFNIIDNNLVITNVKDKPVMISDYQNISQLKYDYVNTGRKISYKYVDLLKYNLIDNTANPISTYKKTSITGVTNFNDYIDAGASGYAPTGKNLKKNVGLTINGKKGSDTIIGTQYNDTITGGDGNNTLIYNTQKFGVDTVKLTKGENLDIQFKDALSLGENDSLSFAMAKNKKDLEVRNSLSDSESKIILKNYYSKDTGATVIIDGCDLTKQTLLDDITAKNYFEAGKKVKKSYTGSALADYVDAGGLSKAINVKKGTGVTLNGGAGYDVLIGSDYNDTIKGGSGDDTIIGGKGNDNLYGVSGNNTFEFHKGDENDTFNSGKGEDTLHFYGENLKNISFKVDKRNLIINYGNNDSVTLKNYFDKNNKVISSAKYIVTKDSSDKYLIEDVRNGSVTPPSTDETDVTVNSLTSDLEVEKGKNYIINSVTSGNALVFDTDKLDNVSITQSGNDVVLTNGEDTVVVKNLLSDTTNLILKDKNGNYKTVVAGKETINANTGDNVIFSSAGNDTINGSDGTNTYIFAKGDGVDHLLSTSGKDIIKFNDVIFEEIKVSTEDDKLLIKYPDTDRIYIDDFFKNQKDITVYTADKKYFSLKNDLGFILGNGNINGDTKANIIAGSSGNDTITAGKGDDKIIEYAGRNVYEFNKGDGLDIIYAKGTDSFEDILKFKDSVMSDLKLGKTTSGGLVINYNGKGTDDKNSTVIINDYFNTTGTEKNKVTKFMLKDDSTVYSLTDDYINYITAKTDTDINGFDRYSGTIFNDEFKTNTSKTEIYSGKEGKNIYNFALGCGKDYVLSSSGKDIIQFSDVDVSSGLTVKKDANNADTISIYYGENDSNHIVLQDYLKKPLNIVLKGTNNSQTTVQNIASNQLSEAIILQTGTGASNSFIYDVLNSDTAQWTSVDNGMVSGSSSASLVDNSVDMIAVFTDK